MEEAVGKELSGAVAKAPSCARFTEYAKVVDFQLKVS